MGLDIAVLGDDDRAIQAIPVGVWEHALLIDLANRLGLELILRLSDYYEDAELFVQEMEALRGEIDVAVPECHPGSDLRATLEKLRKLTFVSEEQRRSIFALAD